MKQSNKDKTHYAIQSINATRVLSYTKCVYRERSLLVAAARSQVAAAVRRFPDKALGWGRRRCLIRLPVALRRFDDQTHTDGLGRRLDPTDRAIYHSADALNVGLEFPLGDTRRLTTHTAQILRSTTTGDGSACSGSFSGKMAYTRHSSPQYRIVIQPPARPQLDVATNNSQVALVGQDHPLYATLVFLQIGLFLPLRRISSHDCGIVQVGYPTSSFS